MELNGNQMFWVQSCPLTMGDKACVLEVVNNVTSGLLLEGDDRATVTNLIANLNRLVITDPMTSLFNRRFLETFTSKRLPELENAKTQVNVAMVDLDDMKLINDRYGHLAGDAVLNASRASSNSVSQRRQT